MRINIEQQFKILFWLAVTLIFLYDRRYLIEKAGLEHFMECVIVRVGLLITLAILNLKILIPKYLQERKYIQYFALLFISISAYVSLQHGYDLYLFNFIIGDTEVKSYWNTFPYTFISTCWYIFITVALNFTLEWYKQRITLDGLMKENLMLKENGPAHITRDVSKDNQILILKSGTKKVKLNITDITYVQGLKDYSIVHTEQDKIVVHGNLKATERLFPLNCLIRVHKSYLVSRDKIKELRKGKLLVGNIEIPVGRTYRDKITTV